MAVNAVGAASFLMKAVYSSTIRHSLVKVTIKIGSVDESCYMSVSHSL